MSQGTSEKLHDSGTKKKKRVHVLPETAIDAGLQALQRLSEAPAPAVKLTARALITAWLPQIIAEQSRGSSLLRIYNDLKRAAKLRISYRSFQNYVSKASQEAGLRPVKTKAEPGLRPGPGSDAKPAPVADQASSEVKTADTAGDWNCDRCKEGSIRRESEKNPGRYFWKCPACNTFYDDNDGEISSHRLGR